MKPDPNSAAKSKEGASRRRACMQAVPGNHDVAGVGSRIAAARQRKGWTQRELSEQLGKSRGTIVQYEQGKIEPPLKQIEFMAKLLEVAPEQLAFGRQGITGLTAASAEVTSVPELKLEADKELTSGAYGLPQSLIDDLGIVGSDAKILVLSHAAPAFGFAAGDRVIVNPADSLQQEDFLYALRTPRGVDVVRLLPNFSDGDKAIRINDGRGETHSYKRGALNVIGLVVASIQGL